MYKNTEKTKVYATNELLGVVRQIGNSEIGFIKWIV